MRPKVSLILCTVGRTSDIDRLTTSIAAQTHLPHEIIIIDQNDDDRLGPHIQVAQRLGLNIIHCRMHPPGLSRARNLGMELATGDIVGFPDDDCWYEPDAISGVVSMFALESTLDGTVLRWEEQISAHHTTWDSDLLDVRKWRNFRGGDASSISLFFRRSALRELGGFDCNFGVGEWYGAGEETDLILRALNAGVRVRRCQIGSVHHYHADSNQRQKLSNARGLFRRAKGTGALYVKHRLPPTVWIRGLLAPPVKAISRMQGLSEFTVGLSVSFGRLVGALAWYLDLHVNRNHMR